MTPRYVVEPARSDARLVLFHGMLGAPSLWGPALDSLRSRPTVAHAVLPGHGVDPWYPADASCDGTARELLGALPFEAPECAVGYSLGARLLLWMVALEPTRFRSVILVGCHPGLERDIERDAALLSDQTLAGEVEKNGLAWLVDHWERLPIFSSQHDLNPELRAEHRRRRLGHTAPGIAWALRALSKGSMPPLWSALNACGPLDFVCGARDDAYRRLADRAVTLERRHRLHIAEHAGHDVALENPAALAALLDHHLAQPVEGRPTEGRT